MTEDALCDGTPSTTDRRRSSATRISCPLFKAEKWDPDALVKFFKECGAHFIMPVAVHHDNFDMYDSSHPWNSVDMGPQARYDPGVERRGA